MGYDVTLTEGPDGRGVQVHRPDCSVVQVHRELGKPICTMIGCEQSLPESLMQHDCMKVDTTNSK
jgi:hypothetical protein